jgi:hypothetical protein
MFGKEGEGVHSIRLGGVAVMDVLGTVLVCWWISHYFDISLVKTLLCAQSVLCQYDREQSDIRDCLM